MLETSFVIVENITLTTHDLVNVVVSNPLLPQNQKMSIEPDDANGEPSAISIMISSSTPIILPSKDFFLCLGVKRCVFPHGLQELGLILPRGYREAKPTMDSTISSLFPIEKVTKEELIEAAFLSSVNWSCKDMNIIGEYDCFEEKVYQHP